MGKKVKGGGAKGLHIYKPSLAKKLLKYAEEGKSFARFCADLKICRRTGYNWCEQYPEFAEAKEVFNTMYLARLEDAAMQAVQGELNTNYGVLKMMLQRTAKEYRQNVLNGDTEDTVKKPTELNITFTEAVKPEEDNES